MFLEDSSMYPYLFAALIDDPTHDWSDDDLAKIANGNIVRVFREVEAVRDTMAGVQPGQVS